MDAAPAQDESHTAFHSHMTTYWRVIITLAVLTCVEFAVAFGMKHVHTEHPTVFMLGVLVLICLAAWKATLVARFFMHLRYDPGILALLALVPVILGTPLVTFCVYDGIHGPGF